MIRELAARAKCFLGISLFDFEMSVALVKSHYLQSLNVLRYICPFPSMTLTPRCTEKQIAHPKQLLAGTIPWLHIYDNLHLQKLLQNSCRRCLIDSTPLSRSFGDISTFMNAPAVEISNSDPRWHPKITVYRLLVISTTISLGSAKAVETFYGKSYASTTIEWMQVSWCFAC